MKATTIALDLVKDVDGTFKVLELNTNVGFWPISQSAYSNVDLVENYVSSSGATAVHYIGSSLYGDTSDKILSIFDDAEDNADTIDKGPRIFQEVKTALSSSEHVDSYEDHFVQINASSVPFIADDNTKFIIRNAYDNTALVDTEYAANTTNFLKLVRDFCTGSNALAYPKSYVAPSGSEAAPIDDIDVNDWRQNGHHPNYIVKLVETGTGADNFNYPKLYSAYTPEAVQSLKDNLAQGEILQEYVYNNSDLVDGKAKTYRVAGLLAGSNLDSIHFFDPYYVSNLTPVFHDNVDYESSGSLRLLEGYERPAYVQKLSSAAIANLQPNASSNTKAIDFATDNEIDLSTAEVGTVLKTYNIPEISDEVDNTFQFTASYVEGGSIGTFASASIVTNDSGDTISIQRKYYLEDGESLELPLRTPLMIKDGDLVRFKNSEEIISGSVIATIDSSGNLEAKGVTNVVTVVNTEQASHIDVEEEDTFLLKGTGANYVLVHNLGCVCYSCTGYAFNVSACVQGTCFSYPGCSTTYPYCYSYMSSTYSGCGAGGKE